jgi:DNA topoisomerase-1
MPTNVVIVESPAKAKTITKYLNSSARLKDYGKFQVYASMGFLKDLPKQKLGVNIETGFKAEYVNIEDKKKLIAELTKRVKEADVVWLASDNDRCGENIARQLVELFKLKKYHRITFNEITPRALEAAITNPRLIDENKADAEECRRVLDRLVGYKLSPLLWKRYSGQLGLSAGRVQSAVLALIVDRETSIEKFTTSPYWYFEGKFSSKETGPLDELKLYGSDNKVYKSESADGTKGLLTRVGARFEVVDAKGRQTTQKPDLPYITSSLQQEAYSKLGCTVKRVMAVAQELYENGLITYMRTDSYNISPDFASAARRYISDTFGDQYVGAEGESKKAKSKNAQEAHEAIRPTNVVNKTPEGLSGDHKKLYEMIWNRTVAYFMKPAIFDEVDIRITDNAHLKKGGLYFLANFKKCKFPGFMVVYGMKAEKYDFEKLLRESRGWNLACGEILGRNTWTSPPARYNEGSLIKLMESESIGRPSTFSATVQKLYEKQYVLKSDVGGSEREVTHFLLNPCGASAITEKRDKIVVGSEKSKLVPTDIGKTILSYLEQSFAYITDKTFTSHMEADLDKIEEGERSRLDILKGFWKRFGTDVEKEAASLKGTQKETLQKSSDNKEITVKGVTYIVRLARFGPVIEWKDAVGGKSQYIGLKPYLKYVRKEYKEINEDDVKLLTELPMNIGKFKGKDAYMHYGQYGFYVKWGDRNVKLLDKTIKTWMNDGTVDRAAIETSIDYVASAAKASSAKVNVKLLKRS